LLNASSEILDVYLAPNADAMSVKEKKYLGLNINGEYLFNNGDIILFWIP